MLVAAAAERWKVAPGLISVKNGVVTHAGGRKATFGELAAAAASNRFRQRRSSRIPRTSCTSASAPRTDSKAKSTGTAMFTQDVKRPDMLTAVVAHPPRFARR